jgi:bacteriocin biosynthesis cyclodehydratase domain-containing protein
VLVRDTATVIGPLVLPGCSPCLRCLELARADRDPAWPALAAQLAGSMRRVEPCDLGLASAAGALTALHLLRWLDRPDAGSPLVAGTLELSLTDLRLRRRSLRGHPGCGCGADQPDQLALDAAVGQRLPIAT